MRWRVYELFAWCLGVEGVRWAVSRKVGEKSGCSGTQATSASILRSPGSCSWARARSCVSLLCQSMCFCLVYFSACKQAGRWECLQCRGSPRACVRSFFISPIYHSSHSMFSANYLDPD